MCVRSALEGEAQAGGEGKAAKALHRGSRILRGQRALYSRSFNVVFMEEVGHGVPLLAPLRPAPSRCSHKRSVL